MDDDRDFRLSYSEFVKGLNDYKVRLSSEVSVK